METSWPMPSLMALDFSDAALQQRAEADRRGADPPIQVEAAAWSDAGTLDLVGEERQAWWGRVRGADGRQRRIKLLIFDRLPALTAGAVSHTLLRAPAPPAGRATVTRPTQQAGLRSSLGGAPSTAST
jgi:hypothetical protein